LWPTWPLAQPAHWPRHPRRPKPSRLAHLVRASIASSREIRFPFWFAPSEPTASPSSLCQPGPSYMIHPLPHADRLEARLPRASPQLIAPRLPASIIATPIKAPYSPALIPPLESPLTPSPAINGVGRKSLAITHQHFLLGAPPAPYKRRAPPPSFTAPLPASFSLSPRLSSPLTKHRHRRTFTTVARPPGHRPSPGEALAELPVCSSLCCAPVGELWRTGAAGSRAPVGAPLRLGPPLCLRRHRSMVD
jgi:hypothetical protein